MHYFAPSLCLKIKCLWRKVKFLSHPSLKPGLWLYFDSNYVSSFEICWLFQMNLVGEFSLICHLEILLQTFQLILLLVLQMMAAWAKETARLTFTEECSIFKENEYLTDRQKIKFYFAWLQHPVGLIQLCVRHSVLRRKKNHFTVWP